MAGDLRGALQQAQRTLIADLVVARVRDVAEAEVGFCSLPPRLVLARRSSSRDGRGAAYQLQQLSSGGPLRISR